MIGGAPSAFDTFIQYAGLTLQLLYFIAVMVIAFAAVWAARTFKRYVDMAAGTPGGPAEEKRVSVEEFVE